MASRHIHKFIVPITHEKAIIPIGNSLEMIQEYVGLGNNHFIAG